MAPCGVQDMARSGRIEALLQRGLQQRDPLLWKVLRNVSQHDSVAVKVKFAASMPAVTALLMVRPLPAGRRTN